MFSLLNAQTHYQYHHIKPLLKIITFAFQHLFFSIIYIHSFIIKHAVYTTLLANSYRGILPVQLAAVYP